MTTEIANVIQMINNKVAKLADEGMNEQSAFDAIMKRMESEYPESFALLINIAAMENNYWIDQEDNITLTNPVAISAAMEAFTPSRDGATPTGRLLNGQFDQANLQEWIEEGTIHGKKTVVFYLFDNSEAETPEDMSFDADHALRIEISI